jgi:hypothetical protein
VAEGRLPGGGEGDAPLALVRRLDRREIGDMSGPEHRAAEVRAAASALHRCGSGAGRRTAPETAMSSDQLQPVVAPQFMHL